VDRILRQQKAERQAAEDAARARADEKHALMSRPSLETSNEHLPSKPLPIVPPPVSTKSEQSLLPLETDSVKNQSRSGSTLVNSLQNLKRKFGSAIDIDQPTPSHHGIVAPLPSTQVTPHRSNNSHVTPLSNICEYNNDFSQLLFTSNFPYSI
jgi:hypothetical protein